jgi:subtilase family serine protease
MEEVRAEMFRIRLWLLILALTAALLPSLSIASTENPEISPAMVRLPGHVLPALARATVVPSNPSSGSESITLTIVLRRDDQAGFESYLHDIYDPHSKNFREFLTQRQIADRFGPRRDDYDAVISYIRAKGFRILQGSRNRLTVTVRGTRAQAESAFDLRIHSYRIGARTFYANDRDPAVPVELAPLLQAVAGLSNLARPEHGKEFLILIVLLAGVCAVVFTALGFFVPRTFATSVALLPFEGLT